MLEDLFGSMDTSERAFIEPPFSCDYVGANFPAMSDACLLQDWHLCCAIGNQHGYMMRSGWMSGSFRLRLTPGSACTLHTCRLNTAHLQCRDTTYI
jgi:hypothetical protein